ncbi:Rieske (2Fe-2S) protein [Alteribacillus sp. HJP-4]|uniref:Rieske (2Fe-2S) protein n=1 Tax=Alteribacillus sp. HJP-4 TaxID=2775394 RepID=UPI0035CCCEE2
MGSWVNVGSMKQIKEEKAKVVKGSIAVFYYNDQVYAVDNRCPHMGFPLHMGSLCNGILTCHWHHARFDINSGGTLDPWADDVKTYEVLVEEGEVWVNTKKPDLNLITEYKSRLRKGLEQNLDLVIAKAVVGLVKNNVPQYEIVEIGVDFGTTYRDSGWGPGLTILTAMANILPKLDEQGRIQALYQGMVHVARDCSGRPPQHLLGPLARYGGDIEQLKAWYRNCIEVRDAQGAERVVLTAVAKEIDTKELSQMLLTAASDHFYIDGGHTLDFHNKAFEVLHLLNGEKKEQVLSSLPPLFRNATRSEELHQWQSPVDLVTPLQEAFAALEEVPESGSTDFDEEELMKSLLNDQPVEMITQLTDLLYKGAEPGRIGQVIALASAERIARFHTQNEFRDWNTVLHTFTHAHAVHESLRRAPDKQLTRALFHGAASIYLDHFLNIPSAKRPQPSKTPSSSLDSQELLQLLDKQQQVNEVAQWVVDFVHHGGNKEILFNVLGHALVREDANFHSYQMYEAACMEYDRWDKEDTPFAAKAKETMLIALARYLAAHAPTSRETPHVAKIAWRLHLGEKLFQEN